MSLQCESQVCRHCGALGESCCAGGGPKCNPFLTCNSSTCGGCTTAIIGGYHTQCAIRTDGSLWCWGLNASCQAGTDPSLTSVWSHTPSKISLSQAVVAADMGQDIACAILADGSLACWGIGHYGVMGSVNNNIKNPIPIPITLPQGVTATKVGVSSLDTTVCFVGSDKALYCFGANKYGLLGNGTADNIKRLPDPHTGHSPGHAGGRHLDERRLGLRIARRRHRVVLG